MGMHTYVGGGMLIKHTQLRPLEHLQLRVRVEKPLHGADVLLVLEPREHLQVVERLGQIPAPAVNIIITSRSPVKRSSRRAGRTLAPHTSSRSAACSRAPC